jgi:hypothetical protein
MTEPVHGVLMDAAGARAFAKREARTIEAADTANMADATDVLAATDATNASTAAEAADVGTSAEAATHMSATAEAAASVSTTATAAARIGLRNRQGRSQQGRRQNRDRLSHRLLHSVDGTERAIFQTCARRRFR